ncbi:MAG TPA: rhodanese-like domain-containing protein [Candidatus Limnocylindrales bacterium]|nr:rhodanese-like domain-containing protein [Candidatus Limnocylindrales bacterium]
MNMPGVPSVSASDAATLLENSADGGRSSEKPLLIDVRERNEFEGSRVAGAVLIPISEFPARHAEIPRDRPLLVMCHMGSRSASATMFLRTQGWTDVRNIEGGIDAWERAGLPVLRGTPQPGEGDLPG